MASFVVTTNPVDSTMMKKVSVFDVARCSVLEHWSLRLAMVSLGYEGRGQQNANHRMKLIL